MKRMDIFCSSPSSTATCSTLLLLRHSHRPLDHHDRRRKPRLLDVIPCSSSELPFHYQNLTTKKKKKTHSPSKTDLRRKSAADASDLDELFEARRLSCSSSSSFSSSLALGRRSEKSPAAMKSSSSTGSGGGGNDQEVALYVSLHCKGCAEKVRKHLSKMEGVKSFSIDLAAKKVTINGDLSPLSVLASVSKVKRAELWPFSPSLVPPPPPLSRR